MDNERAEILLQAQDALKAAGRPNTYITGRGEGTYRGKQAEDPKVLEALERYDADMETLRPYWEIRDEFLASNARFAEIEKAWAAAETMPLGRERDVAFARLKAGHAAVENVVSEKRMRMRHSNKEVQAAGARRYEWKRPQ